MGHFDVRIGLRGKVSFFVRITTPIAEANLFRCQTPHGRVPSPSSPKPIKTAPPPHWQQPLHRTHASSSSLLNQGRLRPLAVAGRRSSLNLPVHRTVVSVGVNRSRCTILFALFALGEYFIRCSCSLAPHDSLCLLRSSGVSTAYVVLFCTFS